MQLQNAGNRKMHWTLLQLPVEIGHFHWLSLWSHEQCDQGRHHGYWKSCLVSRLSRDTIREAKSAWISALECFMQSEELLSRLSPDGELLEGHRRLLQGPCSSAADQLEFYSEAASDRMSYRRAKADWRRL